MKKNTSRGKIQKTCKVHRVNLMDDNGGEDYFKLDMKRSSAQVLLNDDKAARKAYLTGSDVDFNLL